TSRKRSTSGTPRVCRPHPPGAPAKPRNPAAGPLKSPQKWGVPAAAQAIRRENCTAHGSACNPEHAKRHKRLMLVAEQLFAENPRRVAARRRASSSGGGSFHRTDRAAKIDE